MQLHNLTSKTKFRRGQRIGRGGKRGTTSGRGTKGQKARAGHKIRPVLRDIIKKLPKLRGYKFKSFRPRPITISYEKLEKLFDAGSVITPKALLERGLTRKIKGKTVDVKILGSAEYKKKFIFKDVILTAGVRKFLG